MSQNAGIRCSGCGVTNRPSAKECWECGRPLPDARKPGRSQQSHSRPTLPLPPRFPQSPGAEQHSQAPRPQRSQKRFLLLLGLILLAVLAVFAALFVAIKEFFPSNPHFNENVFSVIKIGNDYVGISDGQFAFDTDSDRPDRTLKLQAASTINQPHPDLNAVANVLNNAVQKDTNDPEALIYLEDTRILLNSAQPYITLIVATMFSPNDKNLMGADRDILQGVYVAQKEFDDGAKLNGVQVRVLIANSGEDVHNVARVAQQIVSLAQQDHTVVGVIGWPYSSHTLAALDILKAAHIPMISPTASSDTLSGKSPYFYRVVPPNKFQGIAGAQYAESVLKARKAILFEDPADAYSQTLATDFKTKFEQDGNSILATEFYTVGKSATLPDKLQNALQSHPDTNMIYFAGYADDASTMLVNLPSGNITMVGGDALYELGGYTSSARFALSRLKFTTFAYPDEWEYLGYASLKPAFFDEYIADFDPQQTHPGQYGFERMDYAVMLSFDATLTLLNGCQAAGKTSLTPDALNQALKQIKGANAVQGVTGQIAFDQNGDPVDKELVIVHFDASIRLHIDSASGHFLKG